MFDGLTKEGRGYLLQNISKSKLRRLGARAPNPRFRLKLAMIPSAGAGPSKLPGAGAAAKQLAKHQAVGVPKMQTMKVRPLNIKTAYLLTPHDDEMAEERPNWLADRPRDAHDLLRDEAHNIRHFSDKGARGGAYADSAERLSWATEGHALDARRKADHVAANPVSYPLSYALEDLPGAAGTAALSAGALGGLGYLGGRAFGGKWGGRLGALAGVGTGAVLGGMGPAREMYDKYKMHSPAAYEQEAQRRLAQAEGLGEPSAVRAKLRALVEDRPWGDDVGKSRRFISGLSDPQAAHNPDIKKVAYATSGYSGMLGEGRFTNYASSIPPFRKAPMQSPAVTPEGQKMAGMAAEMTKLMSVRSPGAQLASAQRVGAPKVSPPHGPSIQQVAKPVGFGTPMPGTTKPGVK